MVIVRSEAATAVEALIELVKAVGADMPEIDSALRDGCTVMFSTVERAIVLSVVGADGRGRPIIAIPCDPSNPDEFGVCGVPTPAGSCAPSKYAH